MGISFKVAKVGKRYQPKVVEEKHDSLIDDDDEYPSPSPSPSHHVDDGGGGSRQHRETVDALVGIRDYTADSQDHEVSFSLNLCPDGFSIGKPDEGLLVPLVRGVPKLLHPYDQSSKILFSAIEYGLLPGDIFDDIPCKYVNGAVTCEVRDYRECLTQSGAVSEGKSPVVHKVHLKMCMENVVKDMSSISGSWTYSDLLEVESRIIKSLQPKLCLDPTPNLDKLCKSPVSKKLNLGIFVDRDQRKQKKTPAANPVSSDQPHRNSVSNKQVLDILPPQSYLATKATGVTCVQQAMTMGFQNKQLNNIAEKVVVEESPGISGSNYNAAVSCQNSFLTTTAVSSNVVSMPEHDLTSSYSNLSCTDSSLSRKRSSIAGQLTTWANTKRPKQEQLEVVHAQSELSGNRGSIATQLGSRANIKRPKQEPEEIVHFQSQVRPSELDIILQSDLKTKITLLKQLHEAEKLKARYGSQFPTNESMRSIIEGNLREMQCKVKDEPIDDVMLYKSDIKNSNNFNQQIDIGKRQFNQMQSPVKQFSPYARSHVLRSGHWGQAVQNDLRKEDSTKKRRSSQVPRGSAPESSRSDESTMAVPRSLSATTVVGLQKEKATPMPSMSVKSAAAKSRGMQKGNQASVPLKRKSHSFSNAVSGIGPSSLSNMNAPCNANSPLIWNPPPPSPFLEKATGDPILENFMKIEEVTQRYGIISKKRNFDQNLETEPYFNVHHLLTFHLSNNEDIEVVKDAKTDKISMSLSLLGGSLNICKTRVLIFMCPRRIYQDDGLPVVGNESQKLFMRENPEDRTVEVFVQYGDAEESDVFANLPYLIQLLPNTHSADLFAAQFCSLMKREGCQLIDEYIIANPPHTDGPSCGQEPNFATNSMPGNGAGMLYPLALISGQSPSSSSSSSLLLNPQQLPFQNALPGSRSVTPDRIKAALQLPDTSFPKSHQMDGAVHLPSLNQQYPPHFKRSSLFTGNTSNQMGNIRTNSSNQTISAAHLEFLLHRQNPIMNKMMGGPREVPGVKILQSAGGVPGDGNLVGLGHMSKFPGMSNSISAPIGSHIPEPGNVGQINNPSSGAFFFGNLNQHLLYGSLSPAAQAAAFAELRLANSCRRVMPGGPSFPVNLAAGMRGNNLRHGDLLLGQASSSGGMDQFQKAPIGTFNVSEQLGSPANHISEQTYMNPEDISEQMQVNPQKQRSGTTVLHQVNVGGMTMDPLSPQLSSETWLY